MKRFVLIPLLLLAVSAPAGELPDQNIQTTTTITQAQAEQMVLVYWSANTVLCHAELKEEITSSSLTLQQKYDAMCFVVTEILQGGAKRLYADAGAVLKKAMGRAAADAAIKEAEALEARAVRLRKWAQVIDHYSAE